MINKDAVIFARGAIITFLWFYRIEVCHGEMDPPVEFWWKTDLAVERAANDYLTTMTAEMLNDVDIKVRHAKVVQESYKGSLAYELGTVAAGVEASFENMIKIYKEATSHERMFQVNAGWYGFHLNSLYNVQGEYNKVRLERDLYNKIRDAHIAKRVAKAEKYASGYGAPTKTKELQKKASGGRKMDIDNIETVVPKPKKKIFTPGKFFDGFNKERSVTGNTGAKTPDVHVPVPPDHTNFRKQMPGEPVAPKTFPAKFDKPLMLPSIDVRKTKIGYGQEQAEYQISVNKKPAKKPLWRPKVD